MVTALLSSSAMLVLSLNAAKTKHLKHLKWDKTVVVRLIRINVRNHYFWPHVHEHTTGSVGSYG